MKVTLTLSLQWRNSLDLPPLDLPVVSPPARPLLHHSLIQSSPTPWEAPAVQVEAEAETEPRARPLGPLSQQFDSYPNAPTFITQWR
ncbi:uncharacterized protein G2W53_042592 [Senna tora]|uniref:Uncharacterized protein n=1 Tax=Senna tora TaxID=362788 RepID=A0A834W2J4_9FABA|nr:uncharacterized protein G2W53_042592 [Senna tora]